MNTLKPLLITILLIFSMNFAFSQQKAPSTIDSTKTYRIVKNDGTEFIGKILSQDAREVLLLSDKIGQVIIPKHEIREIIEVKAEDMSITGEYIPNEVFATRYFITTNGLPIEKGESYIQWNLFGPDVQFGVGKNLGVGLMTTWIGFPILGSIKYSINLDKKLNLGLGTLLGTGSWIKPDFAIALPFAAITLGDRKMNINFSAGYGLIRQRTLQYRDSFNAPEVYKNQTDGRLLISVAAMMKMGKKMSFVFDSFIMPSNNSQNNNMLAILVPGIRIQTEEKKAFQFGFAGFIRGGNAFPVPIPFVQWYRKL